MSAILYFHRFTIVYNFTLQQVLLVIETNKVRNFCQQMLGFSIPFLVENIEQKFFIKKSIPPSSSAFSILYFFQGSFTN